MSSSSRTPRVAGRVVFAAAVLAFAGGCVESAVFERGRRDDWTPPLPEALQPTDGAIFPGEPPSGSFLFFDRKARGIGDLVTVVIQESTSAQSDATTDVNRKSSIGASASSDVSLHNLVAKPIKTLLDFFGLASDTSLVPAGTSVDVLTSDTTSTFAGDGATGRKGQITAVVTCRVVDVLPGNVFRIRGRRSLIVNHEQQFLTVEGYVRQQDIAIDNTVSSAKLADTRLTYDGIGVVDDKQRPGIVARVFDWIYPF